MISTLEIVQRLGLALLLSGVIGLDRQRKNRPAGLRTHMLTGLSAAALMIVSVDFAHYQPLSSREIQSADPSRIASYVLAAMGFLGMGTILRGPNGVTGLTTAATLWLVTALGLSAGAGMFGLALMTSAAALFILIILRYLERWYISPPRLRIRRRVTIVIEDGPTNRGRAMDAIHALHGKLLRETLTRAAGATASRRVDFHVELEGAMAYGALHDRLERLPGLQRLEIRAPKQSSS
jgi:putative Mg2+ transporter-C (MgtC) family protein